MRKRNYVGVKASNGVTYERFLSDSKPTRESYGDNYNAVVGPFRTKTGALAMVHYGHANPHIQTVSDAERVGKQHAADLKGKPDKRTIPAA